MNLLVKYLSSFFLIILYFNVTLGLKCFVPGQCTLSQHVGLESADSQEQCLEICQVISLPITTFIQDYTFSLDAWIGK